MRRRDGHSATAWVEKRATRAAWSAFVVRERGPADLSIVQAIVAVLPVPVARSSV
jgi:hypothetical protein